MTTVGFKPLGRKTYGSIGHLPGSRLGPGDHAVTEGQARIVTEKVRDKHDRVIVTEKLDGSCCGVARVDGEVVALGRKGYLAETSRFEMHQRFAAWVKAREDWFMNLAEGERVVGEWLAQAHGTVYRTLPSPFVVFDIMRGTERAPWDQVESRCTDELPHVPVLADGGPISIPDAMVLAARSNFGEPDGGAEGVVYRVERKGKVDYLAKYVRPDKVDGRYLPELTGSDPVWNWKPGP